MSTLKDQNFFDCSLLAPDGRILQDEAGWLGNLSHEVRLNLCRMAGQSPSETGFDLVESPGNQIFPVAMAQTEAASHWAIPHARTARQIDPSTIWVCRLSPSAVQGRLAHFAQAFGLPPAVGRVLYALYVHCDVKKAAQIAGVSFHTARDYLQQARQVTWTPNLARLITWSALGTLETVARGESDHPAGALFSLSARQRDLAARIADGASRSQAAAELGISYAVAKKELAEIYVATGVNNAIGLAKVLAELRSLAMATGLGKADDPYPPPPSRTLIATDKTGRKIVASDYGPLGGKPVLVLHNGMNCRGVDRALVAALQNAGYRPISPDRPGYGDTDPAPPTILGADYYKLCAADLICLCAQMGWDRLDVIAHGPTPLVLTLLEEAPTLVQAAVVDAPEPDSGYGAAAQGMIPAMKRHFFKRPWAVASVARILTNLASHARLATLMREWTANSPADRVVMENPALLMDFYRKILPFRSGQIDGFVREQILQATLGPPKTSLRGAGVTLLIGKTDFMHDGAETRDYWQAILPEARIHLIEDAGRFISYSHPDRVVEALLAA